MAKVDYPTVTFKNGVECTNIDSRIFFVVYIASEVWFEALGVHLTVTSLRDGQHSRNSYHYLGQAVDLRTRDDDAKIQWAPATKSALAERLRERLPPGYDVVVEKTHIHVEYDPRLKP